MKTAAIVQARTASTRFPGKVLVSLGGKSALDILVDRLIFAYARQNVIIAIPKDDMDLKKYCLERSPGISFFEGDPENVRKRVLDCAHQFDIDVIIDITADCPFVDPFHMEDLSRMVTDYDYDYASNIDPRTWPDGFDVQVYRTETLQKVHKIDPEAPHVGWQILNLRHKGKIQLKTFNLEAPAQMHRPQMRLTLDTPEDAEVLRHVHEKLSYFASAMEITAFMIQHSELQEINQHIKTKIPEEG